MNPIAFKEGVGSELWKTLKRRTLQVRSDGIVVPTESFPGGVFKKMHDKQKNAS
jgi:hypothetical protein